MVVHPIILSLDYQLFFSDRILEKQGKEKELDNPLLIIQQPILSFSLAIQE